MRARVHKEGVVGARPSQQSLREMLRRGTRHSTAGASGEEGAHPRGGASGSSDRERCAGRCPALAATAPRPDTKPHSSGNMPVAVQDSTTVHAI